ncbi:ATP-binding protein [Bacillus sp. CGMCC 1.16607]|uniref:ATP-binding protein n=1 Tax=Bacillus sp. CGMCC 1.16607 TaxID=3351842 RepID=UPI00362AA051
MQSIRNITLFPIKEVGEKTCTSCGHVFKIYETSRGVTGACKTCIERELIHSLNLPKLEDLENDKLRNFILNTEKVTSDIQNATVRSYLPKHEMQIKAKQLAISFTKEFDGTKSMVFSGTPGLGKSHLSFAIVKAVRDKGHNALFIKSTHLLDLFRNSYSGSGIPESQIYDHLESLDLLAIDDIGSEYLKANESGFETWASDILYKVFDSRIEKANICSTNYSESELKKKYGNNGERIISRMMFKAKAIRLEGEDFRRQEAF